MGPTIYTSGEFVNEPRIATPAQVEEEVRAQKSDGYDLVKFRERPNRTTGLTLAAYRRMLEVANEAQLPLVGQRADVLLVKGNPLEDLKPLATPEGVIARGRWFSRETLQQALEALREER